MLRCEEGHREWKILGQVHSCAHLFGTGDGRGVRVGTVHAKRILMHLRLIQIEPLAVNHYQ